MWLIRYRGRGDRFNGLNRRRKLLRKRGQVDRPGRRVQSAIHKRSGLPPQRNDERSAGILLLVPPAAEELIDLAIEGCSLDVLVPKADQNHGDELRVLI